MQIQRETVIAELGIEALPRGLQDEIIGDVGQLVFTDVLLAILEKLPPETATIFKTLTEEGKGQEAETLATRHIDNLPALIAEVRQKSLARIKEAHASLVEQ